MRKKQAQHLDARYVTMVENAYYYCNPPPMEKTVRKKRPPLQEYIRKLLYKDLSKVTTEKVCVLIYSTLSCCLSPILHHTRALSNSCKSVFTFIPEPFCVFILELCVCLGFKADAQIAVA